MMADALNEKSAAILAAWQNRSDLAKAKPVKRGEHQHLTFQIGPSYVTVALADTGELRALRHDEPVLRTDFWDLPNALRHGDVVDLLLRRPYSTTEEAASFLRAVAAAADHQLPARLGQSNPTLVSDILAASDYVSVRKAVIPALLASAQQGDKPLAVTQAQIEAAFDRLFAQKSCGLAREAAVHFCRHCATTIDPELARQLPTEKFVAAEHSRTQSAMAKLLKNCDLEVLTSLMLIGRGDDQLAYRWYTEQGEKHAWRRQTLRSWGLFAADIGRLSFLKRAVDEGKPLQEGLLASVAKGLTAPALKRLTGPAVNLRNLPLPQFIADIATLPTDWVPAKDPAALQDLADIVGWLAPLSSGIDHPFSTLVKDSRGKWGELRGRIAALTCDTRLPENVVAEDMPALKSTQERLSVIAKRHGADFAAMFAELYGPALTDELNRRVVQTTPEAATAAAPRIGEPVEQAGPMTRVASGQVTHWIMGESRQQITTTSEVHARAFEIVALLEQFRNQEILPLAADLGERTELTLQQDSLARAFVISKEWLLGDRGIIQTLEMNARCLTTTVPAIDAAMELIDKALQGSKKPAPPSPDVDSLNSEILCTEFSLQMGLHVEMRRNQWAPMMRRIVEAPNGLYVVPLWNDLMLAHEGGDGRDHMGVSGLSHCVGRYSCGHPQGCFRDGKHVVSVRRAIPGSYERLGTAEFEALKSDAPHQTLKLIQFSAFKNKHPSPAAWSTLNWFMREVEQGRIVLNIAAINNRKNLPQIKKDIPEQRHGEVQNVRAANGVNFKLDDRDGAKIRSVAGFDWRHPEHFAAMVDAWSHVLPKALRTKSVTELQALPAIVDLGKALAPQMESVASLRRGMPKLML